MTRRARGEGTVLRDGSGWVARIDLPPGPDGKRRRRKRRARTKAGAIAALRAMQAELDEALDPGGLNRTVKQAVEAYLAVRPRSSRSTKTLEMEQWRASLIVAGLGRRRLGRLTVSECDAFLQRAALGEFGSRAIGREALGRVRSLLVNVLRNEIRTGNVARNVAELSVLPADDEPYDAPGRDEDGELAGSLRRTLTYEEFRRLWRAARFPLLVVVELCGRNGLRPSEARGLVWESVDLEAKTVTVSRQMSSSDKLTKAKTRRSLRTIPVDDLTIECLAAWRAQQTKKRERAGDLWAAEPDLVLSTRFGTPVNRNNLARMLSAACEEAGVQRIVPYELRHTAITLQLDAGNVAWRVADWAGTSERMIEQIYRHRLTRVSDLGSVPVGHLREV